ncbi:MAG: FAD-dependent oxidoreductase, partial [Spirochaetales bacterium]|nr:FAD-dependent oxidoreductase [Spirochaetales bacterium]
ERVEAVEVAKVDERMTPISGTEKIIPCDTLVLSVGLIPEIELIKPLNLKLNRRTQSVEVDQYGETSLKNLFIAGNAQMVFDLVDYVSEKSKIAGAKAAKVALEETKDAKTVAVESQKDILFASPNRITLDSKSVKLFFRSAKDMKDSTLIIMEGNKVIREIKYSSLHPPKMESVVLALNQIESDKITLSLSEDK